MDQPFTADASRDQEPVPAASPSASPARVRTVIWEDPVAAAKAAASLSGIECLRAIADGRIPAPPIALLLGFGIVEVSEGRVVFATEPGEHHYNPIGVVHGGLAATLLDSAMGCAVHSLLPQGRGYTTLELKVNYVRALTRKTGRVRAVATVIHHGRTVATAEGRIVDDKGRLYAHATTTCMIFGEKSG